MIATAAASIRECEAEALNKTHGRTVATLWYFQNVSMKQGNHDSKSGSKSKDFPRKEKSEMLRDRTNSLLQNHFQLAFILYRHSLYPAAIKELKPIS